MSNSNVSQFLGNNLLQYGMTATGNNQATAAVIVGGYCIFTTVPVGSGGVLGAQANQNFPFIVTNAGSNSLTVYGKGNDTIDGNPSFAVPAGETAYLFPTGLNWITILVGGTGGGGGGITAPVIFPERVVTAAGGVALTNADYYVGIAKATPAATAVSLPAAPSAGQVVVIDDAGGVAAAHNITITPAAGTINGNATLVLNTNFASATLLWNGSNWRQIA